MTRWAELERDLAAAEGERRVALLRAAVRLASDDQDTTRVRRYRRELRQLGRQAERHPRLPYRHIVH